ncbi:BPSL0067 family protein [Pseudomonas sp. CGJS7]|uniref:BPSL0067 family protein n=1 Tax=Pseudomonas sp. CGJS7 TaxID=3109348 RepID=UPI003008C07B
MIAATSTALVATNAVAQAETERWWRTYDAQGTGPFRTESATQDAIREAILPSIRDAGPLNFHVTGQIILKNRSISKYELGPEATIVGPWTYPLGGTTYEEALANERQSFDQRSIDSGCTPNTVLEIHPERTIRSYAADGTLNGERWYYKATYQYKEWAGSCAPKVKDDNANFFVAIREVNCSNPQAMRWDSTRKACVGQENFVFDARKRYWTPTLAKGQCPVGNPCDPSTGDKMQPEQDFDLGWISFTRYFHSAAAVPTGGFGAGWTHSHNIRLTADKNPDSSSDAIYVGLIEADGSQLSFTQVGDAYESDDGRGDRAVKVGDEWKLFRSDRILRFDAEGRLLEQQFEDGTSLTYTYDPMRRLAAITHSSGRTLTFEYGGPNGYQPILAIKSAGFAMASYTYTGAGQVETVAYANSIKRKYHYEDTRFPRYLTGVTIEGNKRYSTFAYDDKGRVVSSQHDGGADGVTLTYPATGGAVVTDALGNQTTFGLADEPPSEAPRKVNSVSDSSRGAVATVYNDEDSDFRRRVATTTDRKQVQTRHVYTEAIDPVTGALARTETITEALGKPEQRVRTVTTDVASNRVIRSTVGNQETRITRNTRLQPVSVAVRDTVTNEVRTTAFSYCEAVDVASVNSACPTLGLLKSVDGPRADVNDVTAFEYYGSDDSTCASTPALCTYRKGDLRKTINAAGQAIEVLGYDPQRRVLALLDPNGVQTDYTYNARGWPTDIKVRGSDGTTENDDRVTKIDYEPDGLVRLISTGNESAGFSYDNARRLKAIVNVNGESINFTLDNAGNVKQRDTKTTAGAVTQTMSSIYNALGQLVTAKDAALNATTFGYDKNNNPETSKDPLGQEVFQTYDSLNRLKRTLAQVTIEQPVSGTSSVKPVETLLEYNALDQVVKVTDPSKLITSYAYNGFGDRTKLTSPDTGVTDYTYNASSQLATKKDANDAVAHRYTYDVLGRPKAVFYTATGQADVEYDYDVAPAGCAANETFAKGRLAAARANGTELTYCYDRFGQIVRKTQTVSGKSFTLLYAYDREGNLVALTYPDGAIASFIRSSDGRISHVDVKPAGSPTTRLIEYAFYQPFGPSMGWSYGNGRALAIDADMDYRIKSIHDNASGGISLGYVFNEAGDIKELKNGLMSASLANYKYDELGRLTQTLDGINTIEKYKYDETGNRKSMTDGGGEQSYTYLSGSHRLTKVANVTRSYDAIGNTTSIGGTAREFVYDANDRLSKFKQNGMVKASYRYNARGERASVENGTGTVENFAVYDEAGNWIGDYDATGATVQQAVWLDDAPAGLLVGAGAGQTLMYVQTDHLGTPRAVIDPTRNTAVWTWDAKSEAFGNSPPNQDPDLDGTKFVFNLRFPGQRFDSASGLVYNYFRDYDPLSGRYIQSDPIGLAGGISTYGYAEAAPLIGTDRFGLQSLLGNNRGLAWSSGPIGSLDGLAGNRPQEHILPNAAELSRQIFAGLELTASDEDNNGVYWCAELIKVRLKAPHTTTWRPGRLLRPGLALEPGTAIATFKNGLFPQDKIAHAAIFVGYRHSGDGIIVIDQWPKYSTLRTRSLDWDYNGGNAHENYVNSAKNFSTIVW